MLFSPFFWARCWGIRSFNKLTRFYSVSEQTTTRHTIVHVHSSIAKVLQLFYQLLFLLLFPTTDNQIVDFIYLLHFFYVYIKVPTINNNTAEFLHFCHRTKHSNEVWLLLIRSYTCLFFILVSMVHIRLIHYIKYYYYTMCVYVWIYCVFLYVQSYIFI